MLIAAHRFDVDDLNDVYGHLTNTARAVEDQSFDEEKYVQLLDDLPSQMLRFNGHLVRSLDDARQKVVQVRRQINEITRYIR